MNTIKVKRMLLCLLALLSINQGLCQSISTIELTPTRKGYYLLAKQKEFDNFMALLNNGYTFSGDTIELTIDVIGDNVSAGNRTFSGTFLGGNHKISNLSKPFVTELKGAINHFTIDATCRISGTVDVSSFCIRNYGELRGCTNYSQITGNASGESYMHIGGICAISYGTIVNCSNYGNVTATLNGYNKVAVRCGGITSFQQGKNVIACENYGTIKASAYYYVLCGGINADQQGGNLIGCINHGIVSSTVTGASSNGDASSSDIIHYTGGIVGQAQVGALIDRCKNYGAISNNTQYVGGIAGQVSNTDLYNLINYGRVESVQGKFYSCAAGITGYTHAVNTVRQIINCINKGDVISCSQYGIATAAGICPDIVNCSLANLYSSGSVSAQRIGGTGTQAFEIHDYEYDSQSVELNKISIIEQANAFIDSDDISKKRLLYWKQDNEGLGFVDFFYTYSEPSHGCADFYVFFDDANTIYNVTVIDKETGQQYASQGKSPIRIALLQPSTTYTYEIYDITSGNSDKGAFTTLSPNIVLNTQHVGYDNIEVKQFCDAKGIDSINATLFVYKENKNIKSLGVSDSIVNLKELDEDTEYRIEVVYNLNGKEYKSNVINETTMAIIPKFSLIAKTPYSLTLKCENYEEIRNFNPCLYVDSPYYYEFGGYKIGESRTYELNPDGEVTIDSLLYNYSPKLFGKYTIYGEDRFRDADSFATLNWGGEGIIQLSSKAAMVHGLFGGMGERVPNGGYNDKYDRARFYYRDATVSDNISESYIDCACIDNNLDYATTIVMNSFLYQYYLSLQMSAYRDPKNNSKNGDWQIIDARYPNVEIVEPKFFNMRFANNTFYCSCIQGEETISTKILQYKIEGLESFNEITLSNASGTEALSRKMNSIVPQLTYLVRMACKTTNEKEYYSPIYRLNNNLLELATDINEQLTSVSEVEIDKSQVYARNNTIIIKNKSNNDIVKVYNASGACIYVGKESNIKVLSEGIYFVVLDNYTYKILVL